MADLWPDPQQVLNNSTSAGVSTGGGSKLWPDPVATLGNPPSKVGQNGLPLSTSPFNPNTPNSQFVQPSNAHPVAQSPALPAPRFSLTNPAPSGLQTAISQGSNYTQPKPPGPMAFHVAPAQNGIFDKAAQQNAADEQLTTDVTGESPIARHFDQTLANSTIVGQLYGLVNNTPGQNENNKMAAADFATAHPTLSTAAHGLGMLTDTIMLSGLGAGFNLADRTTEAAGGLANLYPTATRVAGKGFENASIFGIQSFLNEGLKQAQDREFNPNALVGATAGGAAFGAATGGAGGVKNFFAGIGAAGAGVAGLTTLEKYIKNGQINSNDLVDIGVNSAVAMIFQGVTGYGNAEKFQTQDAQKLAFDSEVNAIEGRGVSHEEAVQIAGNLRALSYSRITGQPLTPELMKESLSGLLNIPVKPTTELNQILNEVPESFKNLPAEEQVKIEQAVSEKVKAGEPLQQAIQEATSGATDEPFSHETSPQALALQEANQGVQPFAHEPTIPEPQAAPFAHEMAASGGANVTEKQFANNYVENNTQKTKTDYQQIIQEKYGSTNVVSADHAKEAIPGYNGTNSDDYQSAASKFAANYYDQLLQSQKGKANNTVLIFTGGTGAGKTSALKSLGQNTSQYAIVYDTNAASMEAASSKIDKALAGGYKVQILYVLRDPLKAYEQGVIPRTKEEGRVVSVDTHLQTHQGSYETVPKLKEKYGSKIQMTVFDNSGKPGQAKIIPVDKLPKIDYSKTTKEKLYEQLQKARQQNKLTEGQHRKARGELGPTLSGQPKQERESGSRAQGQGTTLTAELLPGLSKTIEQDIIPKAKGVVQRVQDIYHEMAQTINPTGSAPAQALDIIMKNKGDYEKQIFRTEQTQKAISKAWDKQSEEARLKFMDDVENGRMITGENKPLADSYRQRLNNAYGTIAKYKDGINFLENYFPHFWKKPDLVSKDFIPELMARRPLEGQKSFLKQRIFQTIQEGIDAGYVPVSTNPETLMQIYEQSVAKFEMAQKIKADLKANGMWQNIQNGKALPPGYTYINDPIARAYFPQGEVQTPQGPQQHYAQIGRAAVPTPVARLINNHLSTDWVNATATGRTLMQFKNSMNAIQLGFSAFHASFETLVSAMHGLDIAISKAVRGDILGAAKEVVKAPFNVIDYWRDGQKFFNGDPELLKIEDDLFHGGATLKKNQYFKNSVLENFGKNVREGNMPGALGRLPLAAIEGGARLIMSQVPKVKIGAFRALFANELERKSADIAAGKLTKETIAREVWNNIENRFGQLNYDNLFWNRTFKAINMLAWRAVGWNLGTIRELGGAVTQDLTKFANDTVHGRKPDLTPKMRFTMAVIAVIATISAIYQYLHTGEGPKELIDFIAPKNGATDANGDPVRINWPAYSKDILSYSQHPIQTVENKLSPEVSLIFQLLQNRDYYGNYVYNENDALPTKLNQALKYTAGQFKPFSITNIQELNKGKANTEQKVEGFLGLQKAPSDVTQSARTKAIFDATSKSGPKTPEEQQQAALKSDYRKQIQNGKIPSADELIKKGIVTDLRGYRAFIKAAQLTPAERAFKTLPKSKKAEIPSK